MSAQGSVAHGEPEALAVFTARGEEGIRVPAALPVLEISLRAYGSPETLHKDACVISCSIPGY